MNNADEIAIIEDLQHNLPYTTIVYCTAHYNPINAGSTLIKIYNVYHVSYIALYSNNFYIWNSKKTEWMIGPNVADVEYVSKIKNLLKEI